MRIYGTENIHPKRRTDIIYPDVADIKKYGRGCGKLVTNADGDQRGYWRNKDAKARVRRIYKRIARHEGKQACRETEDFRHTI